MSNDFIQNAVNNLYRDNEVAALKAELANLKAEADRLKADLEKSDGVVWTMSVENERLKESLRLQIEQNALAQVGFKMYQDNVDFGGLHKDRKDAIARLEAENARLKEQHDFYKSKWEEKNDSLFRIINLEAENERLKAEVDRLTSVSEAWKKRRLDKVEAECIKWSDVENENARLKAEVERLTAKVQDWEAIQNAKSGHYIGFCRTEQGLEIIGPITVIGDEVHFQSGIGNKPTHFQRYPNPPQP